MSNSKLDSIVRNMTGGGRMGNHDRARRNHEARTEILSSAIDPGDGKFSLGDLKRAKALLKGLTPERETIVFYSRNCTAHLSNGETDFFVPAEAADKIRARAAAPGQDHDVWNLMPFDSIRLIDLDGDLFALKDNIRDRALFMLAWAQCNGHWKPKATGQ